MNIVWERKVPFNMTLSLVTKDTEAHSALGDIDKEVKAIIEYQFALLLNRLEEIMWSRRVELGKDRG